MRGAARAACPAAWKAAPPGEQSSHGTALCAETATSVAEIDQTIQDHIPAVAFRRLAVLGEFIWTKQKRGARAGGEEKDANGAKINAARRLVHDREQQQPETPDKITNLYQDHTLAAHKYERVRYRARAWARASAGGGLAARAAMTTRHARLVAASAFCNSAPTKTQLNKHASNARYVRGGH